MIIHWKRFQPTGGPAESETRVVEGSLGSTIGSGIGGGRTSNSGATVCGVVAISDSMIVASGTCTGGGAGSRISPASAVPGQAILGYVKILNSRVTASSSSYTGFDGSGIGIGSVSFFQIQLSDC
jgi:hypothetical protein